MLPCPPPRCPAPNVRVSREEIAAIGPDVMSPKVIAANMHYPVVVCVPLEQLLTKPEEGLIWQAVVLKNYGLFNDFEHPVQPARYPSFATEIDGGIVLEH